MTPEEIAAIILAGIGELIDQWRNHKSGGVTAEQILASVSALKAPFAADDAEEVKLEDQKFPK